MANRQAMGTGPDEVVWPVSCALTPRLTEAGEAAIRARVERAVGE